MAEQTFYYEFPGGAIQERTTTEVDPVHPEGAVLLTVQQYEEKRAAIRQAQEQRRAETLAQETAQKKAAYDALVAQGFDPAVASSLSGYTPPPEPEEA